MVTIISDNLLLEIKILMNTEKDNFRLSSIDHFSVSLKHVLFFSTTLEFGNIVIILLTNSLIYFI
jgi:hypothetical protein